MIKKLLCGVLFVCAANTLVAQTDGGHPFPVEGRVYLIHRFSNTNSYIYENVGMLNASPNTITQKQYWQFIPTDNANCYYIQNVTSKKYIQSSHVTVESQIKVGDTPVEYEIKANTTAGAAPLGYYYMCSTDQTIDTSKDGTLGLNFQQSTGKVVAYHIRYNRGNSYWDIQETPYDYEAPVPFQRTAYAKQLGIYVLPCGEKGSAYLTSLTIMGNATDVPQSLNYTATAQPTTYYVMQRKDTATVVAGGAFTLSYEAQNVGKDYTVTAYFDWDGDGVFESQHDFMNAASGQTEITVPTIVQSRKTRLRLRLTDNALEGADDDVHGQTYDFQLFLTPKKEVTSVSPVVVRPDNAQSAATIYHIDGRRAQRSKALKGVFIQGGVKLVR